MSILDFMCGFDDEFSRFDPQKIVINEGWRRFLDNTWDRIVLPRMTDILREHGRYLAVRQHVGRLRENFFVIFMHSHALIRGRMVQPQEGQSTIVDFHKLSAAGMFATLFLGPLALAAIDRDLIDGQKHDVIAKPFLRETTQSHLMKPGTETTLDLGAKFANELLAFRVGCGIALSELHHRARKLRNDDAAPDMSRINAGAILGHETLLMPAGYEEHALRALSQSYFTGCFDILLWPHIFFWLQSYTLTPTHEKNVLGDLQHDVNRSSGQR